MTYLNWQERCVKYDSDLNKKLIFNKRKQAVLDQLAVSRGEAEEVQLIEYGLGD